MTRLLVAFLLLLSMRAHAERPKALVVVIPVDGAPIARDVAKQLSELGHTIERGGSVAPPAPMLAPIDAAKACVAEGHALAFRLDFAAAIRRLSDCDEKMGPSLARPEGIAALSALLVELASAAVAAGERERARTVLARLARLEGAVPPDPALQTPEVMALWEDVRREPAGARPAMIEMQPRWTKAWIDGRAVTGKSLALAPGTHYALAEAAGYMPFASMIVVDAESPRVALRLTRLEEEAYYKAIGAASSWIFSPDDADAASVLTSAYNAPVLLVTSRGPRAVLLVPADLASGRPAREAGDWTVPPSESAARTLARNASRALGGDESKNRNALYIGGGVVAAVLAAGAIAALAQPRTRTGDKTGTIILE